VCPKMIYSDLSGESHLTFADAKGPLDQLVDSNADSNQSEISPSTKIITHDPPPENDYGGPSRTPRMDLRIRRLRVRIPPGAPAFSLVKAYF
jgi:hypothetical protein